MNYSNKEYVEHLRRKYPPGTRLQLSCMEDEFPVPPGSMQDYFLNPRLPIRGDLEPRLPPRHREKGGWRSFWKSICLMGQEWGEEARMLLSRSECLMN